MEKIVKGIFLAILLTFGSLKVLANAIDTIKLTNLDSTIAYALKNNPTQNVYQQQVLQSNLNYKASKSFLLPSISGNFNGQDNLQLPVTPIPGQFIGKPGTTYYAQFGKKYEYNTGLTLEKDLFNWQNIFTAKVAEGNYKLIKAKQDSYVQSLREQVAKLYYSLLVAQKSLEIAKDDNTLSDTIAAIAKQKLEEGNSDEIIYNQAKINLNSVRQNIAQSQQLYDQDIENLKITLGVKPGTEIIIVEHLNPSMLPEFNNFNLLADKSLEYYRQQFETADLQLKVQRSLFLPKLSFTTFLGAQQYRSDFGLSFKNNVWTGYRYLGINISVPIFTGFNTLNKYKSAQVEKTITKIQYDGAVNESAINDRLLIKESNDIMAGTKAAHENYKLYEQNLSLNRQKFSAGIISLDIYLKVFQDYLTAENTLLTNLSQFYANKATILSRQ